MLHTRMCASVARTLKSSSVPSISNRFAFVFQSRVSFAAVPYASMPIHQFSAVATPPRTSVTMTMYGNGFSKEVEGRPGETLLNVAQINDVDQIEGACEGCMCCSTCHMIFDEDTYKSLGPVSDDEQDLIDRAPGATDTSRLGCQVRVTDKLQGAKIKIPDTFSNQMV